MCNDDRRVYAISVEEVEQEPLLIKIYKALGPGGLPSWMIRDFAPFLKVPVCAMCNALIQQAFLPVVWKLAEVVRIPEVPLPRNLNNDLCPISLLPTAASVLESFVRN